MTHNHHFPSPTPALWRDMDTAARCAAITALHGMSASQMAAVLSTTKGAIVGLAYRRRLKLVAHHQSKPRPAAAPRSPAFPVHPPVPESTWEPLAPPVTSPTRKQCCWPVGHDGGSAQMFCGLPRHRGSYCATHSERAYRPSKPVNPGDFEQQNELARFLRDSEIRETTRVAFGRFGGERGEE